MQTAQPGILLSVPQNCRYLTFGLVPGADPAEATLTCAGANARANPSAIWLRAELATQRKR